MVDTLDGQSERIRSGTPNPTLTFYDASITILSQFVGQRQTDSPGYGAAVIYFEE
jgi:hypothetical protein